MNIIVCIKQVPGTNKVNVDPVTGVLIRDGVDSKINPYDLFALETAFSISEQTNGKVKVLSMGPPQAMEVLKEAIYMGADEGALLSDRKFGGADVFATSNALALGVDKLKPFDIIICGKQTTDGDTAQVGAELAEMLNVEHISNVTEILELSKTHITVKIDLDSSLQVVKIKLPCLITTEKDINTPRLPSYNRKKQFENSNAISVYSVADFINADETKLGLRGSPTKVERIFPPEKNDNKQILTGSSQELSDSLYNLLKENKFI